MAGNDVIGSQAGTARRGSKMRDAHRGHIKEGYFGVGRFQIVSAGIVRKEVDRTQRWHLWLIGGERILGNFGELWIQRVSNSLMFREDL